MTCCNAQSADGTRRKPGQASWLFWALILVGLPVLWLGYQATLPAEIVQWETSVDKAREVSQREGRPLLLYFSATWCGPCRQMKHGAFADPRVKEALQAWVAVKVDIDAQPEVARQYAVEAVPTFVLLDSAGKPANRSVGGMSADDLLGWLKDQAPNRPAATQP